MVATMFGEHGYFLSNLIFDVKCSCKKSVRFVLKNKSYVAAKRPGTELLKFSVRVSQRTLFYPVVPMRWKIFLKLMHRLSPKPMNYPKI